MENQAAHPTRNSKEYPLPPPRNWSLTLPNTNNTFLPPMLREVTCWDWCSYFFIFLLGITLIDFDTIGPDDLVQHKTFDLGTLELNKSRAETFTFREVWACFGLLVFSLKSLWFSRSLWIFLFNHVLGIESWRRNAGGDLVRIQRIRDGLFLWGKGSFPTAILTQHNPPFSPPLLYRHLGNFFFLVWALKRIGKEWKGCT